MESHSLPSIAERHAVKSTQSSILKPIFERPNMRVKVPSLDTDPDYHAAKLLGDNLRANRDAAKVEALRLKALEGYKYDDPDNRARIARIAAGETVEDEDEADKKALSKPKFARVGD